MSADARASAASPADGAAAHAERWPDAAAGVDPPSVPRLAPARGVQGALLLTSAQRVTAPSRAGRPLALRAPVSGGGADATLAAAVARAVRAELGPELGGPLGREVAEAVRALVRDEVRRALDADGDRASGGV